jgi:hypothetical protein
MLKRSLVLAACALLFVPVGTAIGGKGGKPPPAPDPVDTGTIYAEQGKKLMMMDTDGTDRTDTGLTWGCTPSRVPHDGKRWYLELQEVGTETYPSGYARHELFAVTEEGDAVQLTDDPDIEPNYLYGWIYGGGDRHQSKWAARGDVVDGKVSYLAIRWEDGEVAEHGVYVFDVDPDDLSSHDPVTYGAGGEFLPFHVGIKSNYPAMWAWYDWSPDGESIVYRYNAPEVSDLLVTHADNDWEVELIAEGLNLVYTGVSWSPDGSRIAFCASRQVTTYLGTVSDIHTVEPDGANETVVMSEGDLVQYGMPRWSPSGDYLICTRTKHPRKRPKGGSWTPDSVDVFRAEADGSGAVNLTADTSTFTRAVAWVDDE